MQRGDPLASLHVSTDQLRRIATAKIGQLDDAKLLEEAICHFIQTGRFLSQSVGCCQNVGRAFAAIAQAFPSGVRVVIDTGYFCTIGEHIWQAPKGERCLSSGSGRYMGIGLPQAIAAAIHDPSVPTVLAVGDGGIAPFFAEARLAQRLTLPLAVLQMSDGGYGSVRTRAIADGLTQAPMLEPGASWRGAFDGIGFATSEAGGADALATALADWRPNDGPLFALLPMESEPYQEMIRGVR